MNTTNNGDSLFIRAAANNCIWKFTMGVLAQKQAASDDVKKYGAMMASDHGKYCSELKRLADTKGIVLTPDPDRVRQNTAVYLSHEFGAAFDRNYISLMADDNQQDLTLYRTEAQSGKDDQIKAFASGIVRRFETYITEAEKILLNLPKPVLK